MSAAADLSLGEGSTPLIALGDQITAAAAGAAVWMKAEYLNPTGSYKDRIAARAVRVAKESGLVGLLGTSSGNGAAAAAAFGARAGLPVTILTVPGAPAAKLLTATAHGARTMPVEGLGITPAETDRVFARVMEITAEQRLYPFITAWAYAPEAMAGAQLIAEEIAQQHPDADAVYVPVGGGGLLTSIAAGFHAAGGRVPRIIGVQPRGSATLARAVDGDLDPLPRVTTTVSGLQVARLLDGERAVRAITETGGHVVEIDDDQAWESQRLLMLAEGISVEPAGAVALAGVLADAKAGRLSADDSIVVLGTGAGWKDQAAIERLFTPAETRPVPIERLDEAIAEALASW